MYAAIIALLFWKLGWKRALIVIGGLLLTFGFCDSFSNLIKNATCRTRPLNDEIMVASGLHVLERGGGYSLFSAHAANSLGLAFCSYIGLKNCLTDKYVSKTPGWVKLYGIWIFFWAFMVGTSRIFVGKHYLGDVIIGFVAGGIAGIAFGYLTCHIAKKSIRQK